MIALGVKIERAGDASLACEDFLIGFAQRKAEVVWLLPDYDRAVERKKRLALSASSLQLGCSVTTLFAWIEDMWALYGDGRVVVSSVQRKLLMRTVLQRRAGEGTPLFSVSAGRIDLLCSMVRTGFGLDAFAEALAGDNLGLMASLTSSQARMIEAARAYRGLLNECGLCELSEAMSLLSKRVDIPWPVIACEDFSTLSADEACFFARLSLRTEVRFGVTMIAGSCFDAGRMLEQALGRAFGLIGAEVPAGIAEADSFADSVVGKSQPGSDAGIGSGIHPELFQVASALYDASAVASVEPAGAVRILLPAGRYAQPALLADAIERAGVRKILVASTDPATMYLDLAPRLAAKGVAVQASYSRAFAETDFGEAFLNALDLALDASLRRPDTFRATDYLLSNLSERTPRTVHALDGRWRADRSLDGAAVLSDINEHAVSFAAPFLAFVQEGSFAEAFDLAESRYIAFPAGNDAFKAEQLAAVSCARSLFEQAQRLGESGDVASLRVLLESASVRVRVRAVIEGAAICEVALMSYVEASGQPAYSFDAVMACDLNASQMPVRVRRTPEDILLEALGCSFARDALFESRLEFLRVINVATGRLYLARCLHDADANPLYPAVAFEEIMSCYATKVDKATAVALPFLSSEQGEEGEGTSDDLFSSAVRTAEALVVQRGEEKLVTNASCVGEFPPVRSLEMGVPDKVSEEMQGMLMEPVRSLSPSAIENYLDCPHKWFATRRLRLDSLDAGFSPLEKGSFLHEVFYEFYDRYRQDFGKAKPRTQEDLLHAYPLLREVFRAAVARQSQKELIGNPLIAITQEEERQIDELERHLEGFIARDAVLLPGFEPAYFEESFGRDGDSFEYAGMPLRGSIDRIDVDARGRAVIVDYKSSLGDSYHLLPANADGLADLPIKVQTLIYAQVARRKLNLDVVGAVYVHALRPGSQPSVCGAYDDKVLGPEHLPGIRSARSSLSSAGFPTFEQLLDYVEGEIAKRLEDMRNGDISVAPRHEKACGFCPVFSCAGRM